MRRIDVISNEDKHIPEEELAGIKETADNVLHNGNKLAAYQGPILIIHAEDDHLINISLARDLYEACTSKNKEFCATDLGRHSISTWNPDFFYPTIENFVNKHLPNDNIGTEDKKEQTWVDSFRSLFRRE